MYLIHLLSTCWMDPLQADCSQYTVGLLLAIQPRKSNDLSTKSEYVLHCTLQFTHAHIAIQLLTLLELNSWTCMLGS